MITYINMQLLFVGVCIVCECIVVYLRLSLTSLPDDNSGCSHGSTLSYGADQVCLQKINYTKQL